jgi:hypothetical protein
MAGREDASHLDYRAGHRNPGEPLENTSAEKGSKEEGNLISS